MSDITIVVDCNDADFARDICAALQQFPDVTALLPHHQAARDAQYASCWFPDPQLLTRSPGLKLIQAASAGVDHLPPALFASEIPLCRVIDEDFRHGMFEYALWSVLWFQRHFDRALAHQRTQTWKLYPQRAAADFHIGIMGLGEIGGYIADQLARLGYRVSGWSRSEKQLTGVTCYRGEEALDHFLGSLDGLINLLPLTAQTRGILAAPLFSRLFPELPRPVYQQESFWALTLDHGWLVVEAEQDPAIAHPLTYARLGYNNLSRLARDAGLI